MRIDAKRIALVSSLLMLTTESAMAQLLSTQDWWGTLGFTHQRQMVEGNTTTISSQLEGDLHGKYYLWQPWFITGNLRLTLLGSDSATMNSQRQSTNIHGGITANILPLSRFPATVGYSSSSNSIDDSTTASGLSNSQLATYTTLENYFITQRYLGKKITLSANYTVNNYTSNGSGSYRSDATKLELVQRAIHHNLSMKAEQHTQDQSQSGEGSKNNILVLSHNYYPTDRINVTSSASKVRYEQGIETGGLGIIEDYKTEIDQLSSTVTWRSNDRKTFADSGIRYTGISSDTPATAYENLSSNIHAGVRHRFNDNISATTSASYTTTENSGAESTIGNYSLGAQYNSNSHLIHNYSYSWSTGISHSHSSTTSAGATSDEDLNSLDLSHSLSRSWPYARRGRIRFSATEAVAHTTNNGSPNTILRHNLRIGYSNSSTTSSQSAQASYNESRAFADNEEVTQLLNLQFSNQQKLTMRASLSGSITHQRNAYNSLSQSTESSSNSVSLNYAYTNAFSFQTLSFNSGLRYTLSGTSDDSRYSWDNTLKHSIGQLTSSLSVRVFNTDQQQQQALIYLNVKRRF